MKAAAGVSAIVAAMAMAMAMAMAATPGAQGKPSQGCAPGGFDELTLAESAALPRIVAGIAAGVLTFEQLAAVFDAVDNDDGLACVKAPPGTFNANPSSPWQYAYSFVDNDASVPSA